MIQKFHQLEIKTKGRKLYNFTSSVQQWIKNEDFNKGIFESKFIYNIDKEKASSCGCGVSFMPRNL